MDELRVSNVGAMRAMAHPLRMRILGSLRIDGPATSAILARRLDTDSGQTSHHLRQLARYDFVVAAPELRRRGRERWWRAGHATTSWSDGTDLGLEGAQAVHALEDAAYAVWAHLLAQYRAEAARQEWSPAWVHAAGSADYPIHTTPAGLTALLAELREVIARHDQPGPGTESVMLLVHGFPRRPGAPDPASSAPAPASSGSAPDSSVPPPPGSSGSASSSPAAAPGSSAAGPGGSGAGRPTSGHSA